jgi:hypothetical protein
LKFRREFYGVPKERLVYLPKEFPMKINVK